MQASVNTFLNTSSNFLLQSLLVSLSYNESFFFCIANSLFFSSHDTTQSPGEGKEVSLVPAYTQQNDITKQRKKKSLIACNIPQAKKGFEKLSLRVAKKIYDLCS
jgi:hypothetical protein